MSKKFGFSFSAKRALGISAMKGKISRSIGVPLTKQGRQRKLGGCATVFFFFFIISTGIAILVF